MDTQRVVFRGYRCGVQFAAYANGRTAIVLVDDETGEPIAKATMNVAEAAIPSGHTLIKDYSENQGLLEALIEGGVVEPTGALVPVGNTYVHLVRLLTPDSSGRRSSGKSRLVVVLEGGLVQSVISDDPTLAASCEIAVIDYDAENLDPEDITEIRQGDGSVSQAFVHRENIDAQPRIDLDEVFASVELVQ
jgi:hypothetical protein